MQLPMTKLLREGSVIVRAETGRENSDGDHRKVFPSPRDLFPINLRHAVRRIPERPAAECTENNMADTVIAQRI